MPYLNWDTKIITDFSVENISKMYNAGYVFTRVGCGVMNKTRSFRIDLSKFEMTSENRRIMRKAENYKMKTVTLPLSDYDWHIGKLAKDFFASRDAYFSANKAKELLTNKDKSNFNILATFSFRKDSPSGIPEGESFRNFGYVISYESSEIFHYSWPFYIENKNESSRGLCMMMLAIEYAKNSGKKYIYLGSLQRPSDTYKLQFKGEQWFNGEKWTVDISPLKQILK